MRKIDELIWHCAATPEGKHFDIDDVRRWHTDPPKYVMRGGKRVNIGGRGWPSEGYHKLVLLDGTVQEGRPEEQIGSHVLGHNSGTLGYCYIGGVDANDPKKAKDTRTPQQKATMERLTREAIEKYGITKVSGHNQYAAKACPSFNAEREYSHLLPMPTIGKTPSPLRRGDRGWRVEALQERLVALGYPVEVDGHFGDKTRNAVLAFQADAEIAIDGIAGPATLAALEAAHPVDHGIRQVEGEKELKERGSRIIKKASATETATKWSLAGLLGAKTAEQGGWLGHVNTLVDHGQQVQGIFGAVQGLLHFASDHWFWILLVVGGVVIWQMRGIRQARVEDHQSGKTV